MTKKVLGLALVAIVCTSQVLSALTSKFAVQTLAAPFFLMWIHTLMMVFLWPLGLLLETVSVFGCSTLAIHNSNRNLDARVHIGLLVRDAKHKIPRLLRLIILLFYPLWVAANYCYIAALRHVPASTMVSIFGSCTAFVSIQEGIWLGQPCTMMRVVAVLLAFGGVVAYGILGGSKQTPEDEQNDVGDQKLSSFLIGVLLGTLSSLSAATYKVAFKRFLGNPSRIDVCLFLSMLGVVNGVVGILPTLGLAHWGVEESFWDSGLTAFSWGVIWCGSFFILVFNASIAFGIAVTSPLFIAVGTVLTIPVTDLIDYGWNDKSEEVGQIAASAAIVASFVLIVASDQHSVVVWNTNDDDDEGRLSTIDVSTADDEGLLSAINISTADEAGSLLGRNNATLEIIDTRAGSINDGENSG